MADLYSKENMPLVVASLALLGVIGFGAYQYQTNQTLLAQISSLTATLATAGLSTASSTSPDAALTAAVSKVAPAVVSIVISKEVPTLQVQYENPFGNNPRYQGFNIRMPVYRQIGTTQEQVGAGTGFLVRSDGYIVTNRHVVDDESAEYTVLLSDGTQKDATVVYRDTATDVAIIKIAGGNYPIVPLGDSSTLELGQTVVAIGNALGEYNNSVSVGIVSGLNRSVEAFDASSGTSENLNNVIQTDAAINLGNSGGPLFNLMGQAVGVNVVTAPNAQSVAFSIPINSVKQIIARVLP